MASRKGTRFFTPGPLGVTDTVRKAMEKDVGARDSDFMNSVYKIIEELVKIAGVPEEDYTAILLQGCGTYSVEAVIHGSTPRNGGRVLIISNGSYGSRMEKICEVSSIPYDALNFDEDKAVDLQKVEDYLSTTQWVYSCVAIVHSETTSGVINDVEKVGQLLGIYQPSAAYLVDAMSSFGAVPLDIEKGRMHFVVSSANKCLQGVPGFSFIIAKKDKLEKCKGNSRSLSLDIWDQNNFFEGGKMFRFTPPTHVLLAFHQAVKEYHEEGGLKGRAKRYKENATVLQKGMKALGFKTLVKSEDQGYIITSFYYPKHPNFDFKLFYDKLKKKRCLIYYLQLSKAGCFRVGHIGDLHPEDSELFVKSSKEALEEMNVPIPMKE